jgi:hypothetical protein
MYTLMSGTTAAQGPPSAPLYPAIHLQWVARLLPRGELEDSGQLEQVPAPSLAEYFPAGQGVHGLEPVSALYFPTAHAAQGPPSSPLYPALHLQAVARLLPRGELEDSGQLKQVSAVDAPRSAEYLPALHSMQMSVPDRDQFPMKPSWVIEESEVKTTLRKPVVDA